MINCCRFEDIKEMDAAVEKLRKMCKEVGQDRTDLKQSTEEIAARAAWIWR